MVGRFGIILGLCCCVCRFGLVDCQERRFAPQNVTATADATSILVTWLMPRNPGNITSLKAFSVCLVSRDDPQISHDHWVLRKAGGRNYWHKVTCLKPATEYNVTVLAVYDSASNISDDAARSQTVRKTTLHSDWWSELWERPIPILVGAALMLLIVLIVLPLICFILYKRRSRRKLRLGSSHNLSGAGKKQTYCKSSSTPSTPLPSTQYLHDMERGNNYHLTPVASTSSSSSSSSRAAAARAIPSSRAAANQRSPLIQYSPPSGYQASTSVPSQVAPGRPGEDIYEAEDEDYENVLVVNTPVHVHVKSTSFSGVSRPVRGGGGGGVKVPVSINEDQDDEDDEDGGTYMNNVYGRRHATMPSKTKRGKAARGVQKEGSIYGNCKF